MDKSLRKRVIASDLERDGRDFSRDQVRTSFAASPLRRLQCVTLDKTYRVAPEAIVRRMVERSKVDDRKYVAERFDCDDFALLFKAECARWWRLNSVGMVADFSGGHAYTAVLTHADGVLSWIVIEPQSDGIVQRGDTLSGHEAYKMERGWVLM